jgi:hypothetical protein
VISVLSFSLVTEDTEPRIRRLTDCRAGALTTRAGIFVA